MYRTLKTGFRTDQHTLGHLFYVRKVAGQIWNDCVQLGRYYFRLGEKWISKSELQAELKKIYPLHSQTVQAVAHKFLDARQSTLEARKKGVPIRYPWRYKKQYNPKWTDQSFTTQGNKLSLSLGNWEGKRQAPLVVYLEKVPEHEIKEVELVWDKKLYVCLSYDDGKVAAENTHTSVTAIDPGEIHTIAAVHENGNSIMITGRKMRSIHRFRNKKIRELSTFMSRCKKYSKQWKKYNRAKQYILSKSEKQLKHIIHWTAKQFVNWCVANQVKMIVIGDPEGVQRNTKKKKRLKKKERQKLSNWSFGKVREYIKYKSEVFGMELIKRKEHYTSQECPSCGNRKKAKGRVYTCHCGYTCHRDLHGAGNILTEYLYGAFQVITHKEHIYLRTS